MTLEERVAQLEQRVTALERAQSTDACKDWRRTVGMFRDDPVMKEIIDEALLAREIERAELRDRRSRDFDAS